MIKIKEKREELGIYQKDLARYLHKTTTCICDWERGRTEPDIESIIKLADYFKCSTDELLGRENYGTGLVEIPRENLTKEENILLESFRLLDNNCKQALLLLINCRSRF